MKVGENGFQPAWGLGKVGLENAVVILACRLAAAVAFIFLFGAEADGGAPGLVLAEIFSFEHKFTIGTRLATPFRSERNGAWESADS